MINYIKIIRPKNLLIVAISQILIYVVYLLPLTKENSDLILNGQLWMLFVVDTVIIAAAGYIINDLMDQKADLHNKPAKIYIGPEKIQAHFGWIYYAVMVVLGFIIAYYIALQINKIHLLTIYPTAVGLLFLYSYRFKRKALTGNLIVSLFCAFVPGIIWYAEYDTINAFADGNNKMYTLIMHLFPVYISFAFLSTLVREIVKDIEDREGDTASGYQTLPIIAGVDRTKIIAFFFGLVLLCSYGFWFVGFSSVGSIVVNLLIALGLILPTLYILSVMHGARSTDDFSKVSKLLKYLMIVSLFVFLCIPFILR